MERKYASRELTTAFSSAQATTQQHVGQPHQFDVAELSPPLGGIGRDECVDMSRRFSPTAEAHCARSYVHVHTRSIGKTILHVTYMTFYFSIVTTHALLRPVAFFHSLFLTTWHRNTPHHSYPSSLSHSCSLARSLPTVVATQAMES
jgi:hypothetical protein